MPTFTSGAAGLCYLGLALEGFASGGLGLALAVGLRRVGERIEACDRRFRFRAGDGHDIRGGSDATGEDFSDDLADQRHGDFRDGEDQSVERLAPEGLLEELERLTAGASLVAALEYVGVLVVYRRSSIVCSWMSGWFGVVSCWFVWGESGSLRQRAVDADRVALVLARDVAVGINPAVALGTGAELAVVVLDVAGDDGLLVHEHDGIFPSALRCRRSRPVAWRLSVRR